MWRLEGVLNGKYFMEDWITQERCLFRREQRLQPTKNKKGFWVHPSGWTAIKKAGANGRNRGNASRSQASL